MADATINNHAGFIWSVADLLRGDYRRSEYGKVILPLTVLRRLDCVLGPTKPDVLERAARLRGRVDNVDPVLQNVAGQRFYNVSPLDFRRLLDDPGQVAGNLRAYIGGFSPGAGEVIEKFDLPNTIAKLDEAGLLFKVVERFRQVDLHPDVAPQRAGPAGHHRFVGAGGGDERRRGQPGGRPFQRAVEHHAGARRQPVERERQRPDRRQVERGVALAPIFHEGDVGVGADAVARERDRGPGRGAA